MNHHSRWIKAVHCNDIPPREGRAVRLGNREIAIFNLGDRFLAIDNRCPHKSGPLAEGIVAGNSVVCPLHAWKVNLETGAISRPTAEKSCVQAHAVQIIDGIVQVYLSPQASDQIQQSVPCTAENSPATWSVGAGTMGEHAP